MNDSIETVEPDNGRAVDWVKESLAAGFDLSAAVLSATQFCRGHFFTFSSSDVAQSRLTKFREGGVIKKANANAALARYLGELSDRGAACVVIEDDVGRRSDAMMKQIDAPSAFIGDRVIHWASLDFFSTNQAVMAICEGAFGYPLNAFALAVRPADLGLATGQPIPRDLPQKIVDSLVAVIVSAFDAESFLIWDTTR